MAETVALVTMLCDAKANLIPLLVKRWNALDLGGRQAVYIAVANDASDLTRQRFVDAADWPVQFTAVDDLAKHVPHVEHERDVRPSEQGYNVIYLHRMAVLREAGRQAALALRGIGEDGRPRPVDWVMWLDQDIDPGQDAFLRLHSDLTRNHGPQAPRVACGLYCTRLEGEDITGWIGDGERGYTPLLVDQVQASRVAGFGCVLMRRKTLRDVRFDTYGIYRHNRQWQTEIGRQAGVLGEDIHWFRQAEARYGVPAVVDNRVRCRHYHADGSYWHYVPAEDRPVLVSEYRTDDVLPGAGIPVANAGAGVIELDRYRVTIPAGGEAVVSSEVADTLRARYREMVRWA